MKHAADSISGRIVAQCDTPHTLGQIQAAFAPVMPAKNVKYMVATLVKTGSLKNLNPGKGARGGGLYQHADKAPAAQPAAPRAEPPAPPGRPPVITDCIVAWCTQPRSMAAIEAEFAGRSHNPSSIVYGAVKAGLVVNLVDRAKHGRGSGGVYVQAHLKQAFWPQEPPGRIRRKRAATKVAEPPPQPASAPAAKRRVSYHHHIPASPLAGGPQWSSLALVSAWSGLLQQGVHYNGPDMT